jgi:hypothetical protein
MPGQPHPRLLRNLIVVTSKEIWDLFNRQCRLLDPRYDSEGVFRYLLTEALKYIDPAAFDNNVKLMRECKVSSEGLDVYHAEVGPVGRRVYFEFTPFHNRMLFVVQGDFRLFQSMVEKPIQVSYPDCLEKPLVWLPFTEQLAFDGQASPYMRGILSGRKPGE